MKHKTLNSTGEWLTSEERWPGLYKKSKTSKSAAIRLFCLECCGGNCNTVTECSAPECPLFKFRKGSINAGKKAARKRASISQK